MLGGLKLFLGYRSVFIINVMLFVLNFCFGYDGDLGWYNFEWERNIVVILFIVVVVFDVGRLV